MTVPVLLGTAAGVMVGLLFYALLVTGPPLRLHRGRPGRGRGHRLGSPRMPALRLGGSRR
jgi:hypothetical protein